MIDEMIREIAALLDECGEWELLAGIPHAQHGQFVAELQRRFFMPPFDVRAASVAAKLWQDHRGLPKPDQLARSVLKADALIIATDRHQPA